MNVIPISDVESERAIMGCMFMEPSRTMTILQSMGCGAEWFFDPMTKATFEACLMTIMNGSKIDIVIIKQFMPKEMAGLDYMLTVSRWVDGCTMANAIHYAKILKEKFELRSIQNVSLDALQKVTEPRVNAVQFVSEMRHRLAMIPGQQDQDIPLTTIAENAANNAIKARFSGGVGVPCRLMRLQQAFRGYTRGKITLVAAESGDGKTTFVNNEVSHKVLQGIPCAVASMEMTAEEWLVNSACCEANLSAELYRDGLLNDEENELVKQWLDRFAKAPLYICDKNQTIGSLCSFMRDMAADKKVELIVIDYIGLIIGESKHGKTQMTSEVSNQLTTTAKELRNTAVIALCQMNRAPQGMKWQEPGLERLKDSSTLGNDAYMVLFLYPGFGADQCGPEDDVPVMVKVEKNRGGRRGKHGLIFRKIHQKFLE